MRYSYEDNYYYHQQRLTELYLIPNLRVVKNNIFLSTISNIFQSVYLSFLNP